MLEVTADVAEEEVVPMMKQEEEETIPAVGSAEKMGILPKNVRTELQEIINAEIAKRRDTLRLNVLNPKNVVGVALKITLWQTVLSLPSV